MAITNGYCTLSVLKGELTISDTADDTRLERVIEAVSRMVDEFCGQFFYSTTGETRYFTAHRSGLVFVDPLRTVTTLKTDSGDDDTYETTWATSDYRLEPRNNAVASPARPYTQIRAVERWFPTAPDAVEVVGDFGWAAIPQQVTEACLIQSSRIQKRKDAPFGIADIPSLDGGGMRLSARLDPDVELMLKPFRRVSGLGMVL